MNHTPPPSVPQGMREALFLDQLDAIRAETEFALSIDNGKSPFTSEEAIHLGEGGCTTIYKQDGKHVGLSIRFRDDFNRTVLFTQVIAAIAHHVAKAHAIPGNIPTECTPSEFARLRRYYEALWADHQALQKINTALKVTPPSLPASEGKADDLLSLKRYDLETPDVCGYGSGAEMKESATGEYLAFDDVEKLLLARWKSHTAAVLTRAKEALVLAAHYMPYPTQTITESIREITALLSAPENKEKNTVVRDGPLGGRSL